MCQRLFFHVALGADGDMSTWRTRLFVCFGWIFNSRSIHSAQFLVSFGMHSYCECYVMGAYVFLQAASKMELVQ